MPQARRGHRRAAEPAPTVTVWRPDPGQAAGPVRVRCRVPFTLDAGGKLRVGSDGVEGRAAPVGTAQRGDYQIEGPASSTSVDWYDTRMGVTALASMERQFRAGVDYFPRHHGFMASVEWDEVMGRTIDAEVRRERVRRPKEGTDPDEQYVLYVRTQLDQREDLAVKLMGRLADGKRVGQSIGGWFTEMAVTFDDEGDMTDCEILDVELDHLAAVRAPANPDADRVWAALSAGISAAVRGVDLPVADGLVLRSSPDRVEVTLVDDAAATAEERSAPIPAPADPSRAPAADPHPAVAATSITSGPEPAPLRSGTATEQRDNQENDMTPEQLQAALAAALAPLTGQLATLGQRLDAAEARAAAPAPAPVAPAPAPAPAPPAPAEDPQLAAWRAQAQAAEARARAAEAQLAVVGGAQAAQRLAAHPTAPAQPAAPAQLAAPAATPIPGPGGVDLRAVAPRAVRAAVLAGEPLTAALVYSQDGLKATAALAKAERGNAPSRLVDFAEKHKLLDESRGAVRRIARAAGPVAEDASREDSVRDLRDMLADLLSAAVDDRMIGESSVVYASFN